MTATHTSPYTTLRIVLFVCMFFFALQGSEVEGKSVTWTAPYIPTLETESNTAGGYASFYSANALVTYGANIVDVTTGQVINDNTVLPVGYQFRVVPKARENIDISWFLSGYWADSPYGRWTFGGAHDWPGPLLNLSVSNFSSPYGYYVSGGDISLYDAKMITCSSGYYDVYYIVYKDANCSTYAQFDADAKQVYDNRQEDHYLYKYGIIPTILFAIGEGTNVDPLPQFYVDDPQTSVVTTGPVSCVGNICTITGVGSINVQAVFSATSGRFRYPEMRWSVWDQSAGTIGLQQLMFYDETRPAYYSVVGYYSGLYPYTLPIPSQTIPFTLTAVSNNNTPTAPTIIGPTSGTTNTAYSFTLTGTDPDSDTIRYGLDWNRDNLVDQWVPSTGYVPSGTGQSVNKLWPAVGTYTFQALTEDVKSGRSGWTTHTITITTPCTTQIINNCGVTATPSGGNNGTCTILGTCNYSCTNGVWTQNSNACIVPACSDGIDNSDLEDTLIDMADPGCTSIIDDDEYNLPENPVLTVNRRTVEKDDTVTLTWDTKNGNEALCTLTAYSGGPNLLTADGDPSTGTLNVTIPARSTYTLSCPNPLGGAPLTDTVSVDIVPVGAET